MLGLTYTELVLTGSTPTASDTRTQLADLPANAPVRDAVNLGHGHEGTATPGLEPNDRGPSKLLRNSVRFSDNRPKTE